MVHAVIEIGSTGIRLLVAQSTGKGNQKFTILDKSDNPVSLGRDVFTTGTISRETLMASLKILERYKEQLAAYDIPDGETTVIATSAVREAANRDPFIDRVKVRTGWSVKVLDGIDENRLMYIAVAERLKDESAVVRQSNSIILDISGGATEMMVMEKGRIVGAHSIRLGTIIVEQMLHSMMGNMDDARRFIGEYIRNTKKTLSSEMNLKKIQQFIVLGKDMQRIASIIGQSDSAYLWEIERAEFENFSDKVQNYTAEEVIEQFKVPYSEAITFQISLVAYKLFLSLTNVKKIIVADSTTQMGLLLSRNINTNQEIIEDFNQQIAAGASSLLKKYQGDQHHAEYVRSTSLKIYDALEDELGLERHARILLEVSAILHDVGMFIRADDHNIHGKYIVKNSEIFGLNRDDKTIVATIIGYHKGTKQPMNDDEVKLLPRSTRMIILKLTAILRLADALDRTHKQALKEFKISKTADTFTIRTKGHHNLSMEKLVLDGKGSLFENVFGYKVVLL
ncbi:HD domain-containing protein [Treponema sp.]|uniref:Ppx/GppA phosphatase family protein n=1 Tax=Treponema sp. TaxID=166 RepID=UPI00298DE7B1|nr:HD domain-containing protein [Treponema sp.]MCQ2240943.1 HD domain-containing protein [Treponema sp.]